MGPTYNSLLLEQLFFLSLNFSLSFFYFPSLSFVSYFLSFFDVFPIFSLSFSLSLKKYYYFLILYQRTKELWCWIVKIYSEDVYDIFYHKWFVYIFIAHTKHISLYFFITLFKFYKICVRRCAQMMTCFFFFISKH